MTKKKATTHTFEVRWGDALCITVTAQRVPGRLISLITAVGGAAGAWWWQR